MISNVSNFRQSPAFAAKPPSAKELGDISKQALEETQKKVGRDEGEQSMLDAMKKLSDFMNKIAEEKNLPKA